MMQLPAPHSHAVNKFRPVFTLGLAVLALSIAEPADAQRPTISITEPVEWREQPFKPLQLVAGRSVRIAGSVTHPASVDRVLVNGKQALLVPDATTTDTWDFEVFLPPDSIGKEVTIIIVPKTSQRVENRFPGSPDALQSMPVKQPEVGEPRVGNPWSGFKKRGALYGVVAAGGAYLAVKTSEESSVVCRNVGTGRDCFDRVETKAGSRGVGLGLAGAAIAGFVIDAVITSGKAKSQSGVVPSNDQNGFDFSALTVESVRREPKLNLFQVRFYTH
jgi:hypothetical protein